MTEVGKLLVLHGPNLDRLGTRDPEIYGADTLADIDGRLKAALAPEGYRVDCRQSGAAEALVAWIRSAADDGYAGVVLNAGAFTHFEESIAEAVSASEIPVVEVHLSNVYSREEFRHRSVIAPVAVGQVTGFGWKSYLMALRYLAELASVVQEEAAS